MAFSWVVWPDKATRDAAMKKMMEDPRMDPSTPGNLPMPFDGKRMIFGGLLERISAPRCGPAAGTQRLSTKLMAT